MVGIILAAVALLLVAATLGLASWVASSLLLEPHRDLVREGADIRALRGDQVELSATRASVREGTYGLAFPGGYAVVGQVLHTKPGSVTRELLGLSGRRLRTGDRVGVDPDVFKGDPLKALGIPFREITYPDPLGPMPAWLVPGEGLTWAIFVHGIDGTREDGLRDLPPLVAARIPTLVISYRNDPDAPRSPDGMVHLGMTEWQDLEAAAGLAVRHGARDLVLLGDSIGGAIVTRFMRESPMAARVSRLVLDSPALDWRSIIARQAERLRVPFLGGTTELMIKARIGIDWAGMDEIAHASDFRVPILLFQGLDDDLVPAADSEAFARRLPGLVTLVRVPGAGHVECWNVDPEAYEERLRAFVSGAR